MEIKPVLVLYQAINFVVLMVILGWLFSKFIRPFMKKRAEEIKEAFAEAEARKKDVEVIKEQYATQLAALKDEAKQTIDKAVNEGNQIREDIIAQADKDRVELLEKARREIEHEKRKAILEIQKEVANLAVLVAGKLIKKRMDDQSNKTLVEEFIREIENKQPESR